MKKTSITTIEQLIPSSCGLKTNILGVSSYSTSPILFRLSFLGLLPFPQYDKMAGVNETLFELRHNCRNKLVFKGIGLILLFRRKQQIEAA